MPQRQPLCAAADPPSLARRRQRRRALRQARDCVAPPLAGKDPHLSQGRPATGCQFSKGSDFLFFGWIYNRWHRGLSGGTPETTTIIIRTTLCTHRYISQVRLFRVLIFMYQAKVGSWYYDGRSCPICIRCFHRCSARIPTITSVVVPHSPTPAEGQRRFLFSNRAPGDDGAACHVARSRVAEKCRPGPVCRQLQQYRGGPVPCSPGAPPCRCAAIPPLAALTCQARARGVPHGARVEGPPPPTLSSGGSARESEGSCRSLCTQPRRSWPDYLRCASPAAWPSRTLKHACH